MHDYLLDMTSRALVRLEDYAPQVDDLLPRGQAASGTNAGKPPARRGSKPPLSVDILSMKQQVESSLDRWCGQVVRARPELVGADRERGIAGAAVFLRVHLLDWEQLEWAEAAASDVIGLARFVGDVVDPPAAAGDPEPLEVGTARQIASWCRNLGANVTRARIQEWIATGAVPSERTPDGRRLVRLSDVLEQAGSKIF